MMRSRARVLLRTQMPPTARKMARARTILSLVTKMTTVIHLMWPRMRSCLRRGFLGMSSTRWLKTKIKELLLGECQNVALSRARVVANAEINQLN